MSRSQKCTAQSYNIVYISFRKCQVSFGGVYAEKLLKGENEKFKDRKMIVLGRGRRERFLRSELQSCSGIEEKMSRFGRYGW